MLKVKASNGSGENWISDCTTRRSPRASWLRRDEPESRRFCVFLSINYIYFVDEWGTQFFNPTIRWRDNYITIVAF